jgi:vitamin B12/bleomycin/antimicrobial peptide transport system ATP-binding/permease protein
MKARSIADQPAARSDSRGNAQAPSAGGRLVPQVRILFGLLWASPQRTKIVLLSAAIIVVIGATAYGQIMLNAWNRPFYDAITRKDLRAFLFQLTVFGGIAGALLVLNVAQTWLNQAIKVKLREGLAYDILNEWLKPKRAFRLMQAGEIGDNPDQRIHEDSRHLTELSADLAIGLLQSSLLLGSFISVLWALSNNVTFHLDERRFSIPGYMVWCALASAGAASWLSWLVGRPLVPLNAERYAQEAELRFALVRLNEHIDNVALYGGEEDEKLHIVAQLRRVLQVMWQTVNASTRLTWITAGYGWFTIIAPIVVAAPGYFGGDISFGALMMAVGAFMQVQQTLRWFIDNFSTLADWRATLLRIANFRETVVTMDRLGVSENRIEFVKAADGKLAFENLQVATPTGCTMLSERHVEIAQGDRVLIVGEPGTGKTILFRAIAGLWPWGSGQIGMPSSVDVMFVARQPYVPLGTLRAGLAYPASETAYSDEQFAVALKSAGLDRLCSSLDINERWDRELSDDEQQLLVFARILLNKPRWVVIDEAFDAMDEDTRERIFALLNDDLKDTTIIHIGRPETKDHFFARTLHLIKDPLGSCFLPNLTLGSSTDPVAGPASGPG